MVIVEFDENITVEQAKQKVKDEIDTETQVKIGQLLTEQK